MMRFSFRQESSVGIVKLVASAVVEGENTVDLCYFQNPPCILLREVFLLLLPEIFARRFRE